MPDDVDTVPAPPCKFRCNRARMTLVIRVTLHHIGSSQINLRTTPTAIELDTLKARRKFKLNRSYPRGIECDDSQTTAKLDRGSLVVEMPITKLPAAGAKAAVDARPAPPPAGAKKKKRARSSEVEELDDDDAAQEPQPAKKKRKQQQQQKGVDGPSADRIGELMDAASDAQAKRAEGGLKGARQLQQAETDAANRARAKKEEREASKRKLLETFKRQQQQARAQGKDERANVAAAQAVQASKKAASAGKKKKRVSFGDDV